MVGILSVLLLLSFSAALAQERGWEKGWNETVAAGKKEGKFSIYHTTGPFDPLLKEFEKRYPGIKTSSVVGVIDPKVTGIATSTALSFFYYNQELGPKFLTQLFKDMDLVFSGDTRQLSDWLSVGKVALALFNATEAATARRQGLPVDVFPPDHFKEGTYGAPRQGTISFIQQAPHPNAAKLFVNWLLSKEGQTLFQQFFTVPEEEYLPSMRLDVSKEHIPAAYRLSEGTKFLPIYRPEYIDPAPARKVIEEALVGVKR